MPTRERNISCPYCGSTDVMRSDHILECQDCGFVWEDEEFRIKEEPDGQDGY